VSDGTDDAVEQVSQEVAADFRALLEKLSGQYNFDFREYKEASLARRIRARMSQAHVDSFAAYSSFLDANPNEHVALFNTILINVTNFFRDPDAWKVLADDVLPRVVDEVADTRSIRIWSAGCSSGEEPYSIAMLLAEHLGEAANNYSIKIYGTDFDEEALTAARHALFRTEQLKDVPDRLLERYFTRDGQLYRFRRDVRRWCMFGSHNLTQAPPLSHIDLLVCRNVLIYFTSELQDRILNRFHYSIREDGFLFLGRSESLLARSRQFRPVHLKWRIFRRMPAAARQAAAVLPEAGSPPQAAAAARPDATAPAARVQRAFEVLPAAVMVIDMTDTILSWNPAAEAMFDIPIASALTRKFRDLDVSYRVEGLRARIEDVKARHAVSRMDDVTFTRRNGDMIHADVTISPLFEAYRLIGVLVYATEATEHARLKEQMARIAEQHATAIEELQSTNEELETTNEELQSTNEELETTNEELQSTNEELETTVEELQAANSELGALNAELEGRSAELKRVDGYHLGLLNSMEQSIFVTDRALVVTTWNQPSERMWGLRAEQAVGRDLAALPLGDMVRMLRPALDTALKRESTVDVSDVPYTLPGGEVRKALVRIRPLWDSVGDVIGVIGTAVSAESSAADKRALINPRG
jgi:two-component system, chemotaxis family, CheB/CheR fusion protein